MHCNMKTMAKAIAAVIAMAIIAYIVLPGAREFVITFTPILLTLVCPVMMLGMMWMMRSNDASVAPRSAEPAPATQATEPPVVALHQG